MQLIAGYVVLLTVLTKALLVRARMIPGQCTRCGRLFERHELGQPICTCGR